MGPEHHGRRPWSKRLSTSTSPTAILTPMPSCGSPTACWTWSRTRDAVTTPYDNTLDWAEGEARALLRHAIDTVQAFGQRLRAAALLLRPPWTPKKILFEIIFRYLSQMLGPGLWRPAGAVPAVAGGPMWRRRISTTSGCIRQRPGRSRRRPCPNGRGRRVSCIWEGETPSCPELSYCLLKRCYKANLALPPPSPTGG